jgi:putative transposase
MVRAGVVEHPSEWGFCGYHEILTPRQRYTLIDYDGLRSLLNFDSIDDFAATYRGWIEESLGGGNSLRDAKWTESVAVGSEAFVTATKEVLGDKGEGRAVIGYDGSYELRESPAAYKGIFGHKKVALRPQNEYLWRNTD